jgi:VanZ family protein
MGLTVVLLYMVLLACGAMIAPGVGVFGGLLVMIPNAVTEWSHAPAYGLLTWLLTAGLQRRGWPRQYALSVGMSMAGVFGLWMEIFQGFVPGRVVDSGDLMVNTAGIGIAALLLLWQSASVEDRNVQESSLRAV